MSAEHYGRTEDRCQAITKSGLRCKRGGWFYALDVNPEVARVFTICGTHREIIIVGQSIGICLAVHAGWMEVEDFEPGSLTSPDPRWHRK